MKIAVAVPSHDMVHADFARCFANLCAYTASVTPDDWQFGMLTVAGTYIHSARNTLMQMAMDQGIDAVLWLDSDMTFPKDAFIRLLKHRLPVVGINYSKRKFGEGWTALKSVGEGHCVTTKESTGIEQVEALGFGCVLIRREALEQMPDPKTEPWFQHKHLGDGKWMGEDVYFCALLQRTGVPVAIDHDLSRDCRHIGSHGYSVDDGVYADEPPKLIAA